MNLHIWILPLLRNRELRLILLDLGVETIPYQSHWRDNLEVPVVEDVHVPNHRIKIICRTVLAWLRLESFPKMMLVAILWPDCVEVD